MTEPLTLLYFPAAIGLGALHALEPGHAKTMMAAYLIGVKGTKRDAVLLGTFAAATHSLVVIAIAAAGLFVGNKLLADDAARWLERGSGFVVIALGLWMVAPLAASPRARARRAGVGDGGDVGGARPPVDHRHTRRRTHGLRRDAGGG